MANKAKSRFQKLNDVVQRYLDEFHKPSLNLYCGNSATKVFLLLKKHSTVSHRQTITHQANISSSDEHESIVHLAK